MPEPQKDQQSDDVVSHLDNWNNVLSGLGTSLDKAVATKFRKTLRIPDQELSNLFHGDDISRRIVSVFPQEMSRKGYLVTLPPDQQANVEEQLLEDVARLEVNHKFFEGMIWGDLFGGAVAVLGINDGQEPDQPVNENNIQSIDFINIIDKRYLQPIEHQNDPMLPDFGKPTVYIIQPRTTSGVIAGMAQVNVHKSRLIIFPGVLTSDEEKSNNNSWDFSKLQTIEPVIRDFQSVWLAVGNLIQEASVGVFKIKGLAGLIAANQKKIVEQRVRLVDTAKSTNSSIILDADTEEYTRIGAQLTELSSLLDRYMLRLSSAVEIPVTILMGQSPAGMNATGEGDFKWFYDLVASKQKLKLQPKLHEFYRLLFLSKAGPTSGRPVKFGIKFNPLTASTPKEQAELEKMTSERDKNYIDSKVLKPEEVAVNRFTSEGFRQETFINLESRKESLELQKKVKNQIALPLTPPDIAKTVTVDEARASEGLAPFEDAEKGALTVFEFAALGQKRPGGEEPDPPPGQMPFGRPTDENGAATPEEEEPKTPGSQPTSPNVDDEGEEDE